MTMDIFSHSFFLWILIFLVGMFYSSVGHGGASGYLAALSLFGYMPAQMRESALILNLGVSAISFAAYCRAGHFQGRLLWPFAVASVPLAFAGGWVHLPQKVYSLLLAGTLIFAALRLWGDDQGLPGDRNRPPGRGQAALIGGGIGFLSGAVGVGGGIFLSPLMILMGWADARRTAAASAAFIWINSAAGLLGGWGRHPASGAFLWPLAVCALAGGVLGSQLGARRLTPLALRRVLAGVLAIAALKLLSL